MLSYSAASTYFVTGSLGKGLKAGVIHLVSAQAHGAVSAKFDAGTFGNILGNTLVGGITSKLSGGNFGHGFWAAGFTAAFKPMINLTFRTSIKGTMSM